MIKVIVFIPAYNEEENIGKMIDAVKEECVGVVPWVIDDGSSDNTRKVALAHGAKVISHPKNMGLGAATRTGLKCISDYIETLPKSRLPFCAVKIDADGQHDVKDIIKVVSPIVERKADVVFGSRFLGGLMYKMPFYRAIGNKFFSYLTWLLVGQKVTDGQTGLMAFHEKYLRVFEIPYDYNETQQLIMDACYKRFRVVEVPVLFHKRTTGKSFVSFKYPFKVLPAMFKIWLRYCLSTLA
jgi:glycosyltransferase involved in cell wall biosynthesis